MSSHLLTRSIVAMQQQILYITDSPQASHLRRQELEQNFGPVECVARDEIAQLGIAEIETANGESAEIAMAEEGPLDSFELILLEIAAMNAENVTLCKQIRQLSRNPLIVFVPKNDEQYLLHLYAAGASECIVGDIDPALLRAKLTSWLRWRASSRG